MADFRDHIATLKKAGELVEIHEEVDWNLEASAFTMMSGRVGGPAFLFNNVKGYPKGHRLFSGMYAGSLRKPHRRAALVLGLDPECSREQFAQELFSRMQTSLKPVEVATGPCKEVIKMGRDINLYDFPFPTYAQGDGGRYSISQAHICKDPDSDWVNWANYRAMLYSRNRYAIGAQVGAQFDEIFIAKYLARNQSMPIATVIGGDPVIFFVAGMYLPPGVSEADVAGGLRQAPLELVKCETSDILVPADAEIVIEGEVRPNEYLPEGPLSEASLFQASPRLPNYGVRVTCITHRKDPITPLICQPPGCDAWSFYTAISGAGVDMLARVGLGLPIKAGGMTICTPTTISAEAAYHGMLRDAADRLMQSGMYSYLDSTLFVDGDVNPFDCEAVMEAMLTQINPKRDILFTDSDTPKIIAIGPYLDDIDLQRNRKATGVLCAKRVLDSTTKGNPGVRRINFETSFPTDMQRWVVDNWPRLGFAEEAVWNKPFMDMKPMIRL